MSGLTGARLYASLFLLAGMLGLVTLCWRFDSLRAGWKLKYEILSVQAGTVLAATRTASENPKLTWPNVAEQIDLLGTDKRAWQSTAQTQSRRIDELGLETIRLKALSAEARKRAEVIIARRDSVIARLADAAIEPGDRADCVAQLRDVEASLDAVYREGL